VCLAGASTLLSLEALDLSDNPIGDDGVAALSEANSLGKLVELNLSRVGLTARGAERILRSAILANLSRLNLSGSDLSGRIREELESRFEDRVQFGRPRS
jgi:Ran GTPase-activating protein (RanGAP) involved in mRNA processing and transport